MDKSPGESCLSNKKLLMKSVPIDHERVNEALIPGLPDDLALICLAKISHGFLGVLECVCKRWKDVIRSEAYAFYKSSKMGRCGDWLFVFMEENDGSRYWKAYDPEVDMWHPIPPMPRTNELIEFSCVSVHNRLLVIGGFNFYNHSGGKISSTNQVLSFDPYRQEWSEVACMSTGRATFACSVICDKVYVGGGYSSAYKYNTSTAYGPKYPALSSAEVYDPVKDRWDELPPMPKPRVCCFGVAYNNKFYILSKSSCGGIMCIFSLHDKQWYSRPDVRKNPTYMKYDTLVINDHLYTIVKDSVQTVNIETGDWYHIGLVPALTLPEYPQLSKSVLGLVCSLRNKLYIIGGIAIDPAGCDPPRRPMVYPSTVRFCDPSTTPLQWRETQIHDDNCEKLACASLEECAPLKSYSI